MSGKGKGKHIGRKNKRLRHAVVQHQTEKKRQQKHQDRIALAQIKAQEREELLEKALSSLCLKKAGLKRLIGTLNTRRIRAVVDNKYLVAPWFIGRTERRQEKKYVRLSPQKSTGTDAGVPGGTNTSDGNS